MIILASGSPRREELLKKICAEFLIEPCDVEEIKFAESPKSLAIANAKLKAETVAKKFPQDVVIGADTIVVFEGKIFGKPQGERGAFEMLNKLSGKRHEVITGLAIVNKGKTFLSHEVTEVFFGEMTDEEILNYVSTGEPLDKSGSYALQGGTAQFIEKIHGDWSNVVGLPLYKLRLLAKVASIKFS
ncbi:MAG: septum formation protein Maf [Selenomonadaceae bacterium]|nr:septum formation protein Maf [Selenomonadaceae bacterium]